MALVYRSIPTHQAESDPVYGRPRDLNAREGWWWQPGPVNSCCCCGCSLRVGVGLLAFLDMMNGAIRSWYMTVLHAALAQALEILRTQLAGQCEGDEPLPSECETLRESTMAYNNGEDFARKYASFYHLTDLISFVAGLIGLWAAFRSNALAAKTYLWSTLTLYLLQLTLTFLRTSLDGANYEKANSAAPPTAKRFHHDWGTLTSVMLVSIIVNTYFLKVIWSYHEKLRARGTLSTNAGGGIELDRLEGTTV